MARIEIARLEISERAADKFWVHGIGTDQVESVLDREWTTTRNRAGRAAPYVLIGIDEQGRCLAIPIVPTDDLLIWMPVTAWYCKPSEFAILRKRRRLMENQSRYQPTPEPREDDDRDLMDPEAWDWNSTEVGVTVGEPGTIFTMEFSRDEHRLLAQVARAQGITTHAFIKQAALATARQSQPGAESPVRTPRAATG